MPEAFDKAWSVVKDEDPTVGSQPNFVANERQHMKRRMAEDDLLMPVEKPFKMRKPGGCKHNFEITDEGETDKGVLYRTLTCSECKESHTSSPS